MVPLSEVETLERQRVEEEQLLEEIEVEMLRLDATRDADLARLAPGDFVFCPEGRAGLHAYGNPHDEPARILGISAGSFPDIVAYPEHEYAWVATRDPDLPAGDGDPGIIQRFDFRLE